MKLKHVLMAASACGLVMGPAHRAAADNLGAFAAGAVVMCIASGTCRGKTRTRSSGSSAGYSYQRQQNREVQASLNYFGYPAGSVDGVLGRNSRNAIAQFQADMSFPVTGQLDTFQRDFLVGSHQRAQAGAIAPHQAAFSAQGPRGFLRALRSEQTQVTSTNPFGTTPAPVVNQVPPPPVTQQATVPVAPAEDPARSVTVSTSGDSNIPVFGAPAGAAKSMQQHCNEVNVLSIGASTIIDPSNVTDPGFTLSQQFCVVRNEAIGASQAITETLVGITDAQLEQQCGALVSQLQDQIDTLAGKTVPAAMSDASSFAGGAGLPAEQLKVTGKVCLGVGYQVDNPEISLASAILMVGSGEPAYGEVLGHHLREGFGTVPSATTAKGWYDEALGALDLGATPAFVPDQSAQRTALLRTALGMAGDSAGLTPGAAPSGNSALPTFVVQPSD